MKKTKIIRLKKIADNFVRINTHQIVAFNNLYSAFEKNSGSSNSYSIQNIINQCSTFLAEKITIIQPFYNSKFPYLEKLSENVQRLCKDFDIKTAF